MKILLALAFSLDLRDDHLHFAPMQNQDENQRYCLEMVQKDDRERYLVSLFAPNKRQRPLWALLAFNQEVARIRENVSEGALGEIRLQWWSEVLEEIQQGQVRQQPVIAELAELEHKKVLIWPLLNEMLEARKQEMFQGGTASFGALTDYANGVGGALHEAFLHVLLDADVSDGAKQAARASGCAWAMMGLIRALPFHWQSGRNILPAENDAAMQMREAAKAFEGLRPTISKMRGFAEQQLLVASEAKADIPRAARYCLLHASLVRMHLKTLAKAGDNPFEMPLYELGDLRKIWGLNWANITGRL